MHLPLLITSDLHLVSDDATLYRWKLFPWLAKQILEHGVKTLCILGDLTDAKDNHPSVLVNSIVQAINSLPIGDIRILAGNHDWLQRGEEFFRFLNMLPNVEFITKPTEDRDTQGALSFFLPYSKNPVKDWAGMDFSHYDLLFMHQTIKGAVASNGEVMEGEALPELNANRVYSGDIHVPQRIGPIIYVGSPYHVHFGDDFKPRCLLLDKTGKESDLYFNSPRRVVCDVSGLAGLRSQRFRVGDQVKLRISLAESEKHGWSAMRREALKILQDAEVVVNGIELKVTQSTQRVEARGYKGQRVLSAPEAIQGFVEREELSGSVLDAALEIIDAN